MFRLTLASGKTVRATENHPFLTYEGWMPLAELRVGGRVAVPRHVPSPRDLTDWDDSRVILLGHLIGDGSFVRRQPIRYASIDPANLEAVTKAALVFGVAAVSDEYPAARCTTLRLRAPFHLTHGRRNPIAEWLDGLGLFGARSHEKFVPDAVFSLPKEQIALFLRHLWATDGSVTVRKDGRGGRVYYASTSRRLADGISRLLLRFGIQTRLSPRARRGTATATPSMSLAWTASGGSSKRSVCTVRGPSRPRGCWRSSASITANTNVDTVPRQVWERRARTDDRAWA